MHQTTLNTAQQEAVLATEGPLLILAGAGAGKTKTITHRILHLIRNGVHPHNILAVTFTNKAAREMRERVSQMLIHQGAQGGGGATETPFVSTFHALCIHLLRTHAKLVGLNRHFVIFDRSDSAKLIKRAMEEVGIDTKQFSPRTILGTISKAKGDGITVGVYTQRAGNSYYPRLVADVWIGYDRALKEEKALDFDDILVRAVSLLREHPDVLAHYQKQWRYVHVDEYQDTNRIQFSLITLLAKEHRNICCVGDSDQSIYAWRGADMDNILRFEETFPDARVILLEQNYRSTKTIVAASNAVIKKNVRRKDKTLFTENEEGEKITLYSAFDEGDEARFVAEEARELIGTGVSPETIAVLYRANFQSRVLEEAFITRNIPYQVLGVRFFERKEVKDVLSFIRLSLSGGNADLARIINVPPRGIGNVTFAKILSGERGALTGIAAKKVAEFFALIERIRAYALANAPSKTVRFVVEETGISKSLSHGGEDDQERLENIRELSTLATKYDSLPPEEGVRQMLDDAALMSDQDELRDTVKAVRLMTVHAAKGLEFDVVFVVGLEEGLFPHEGIDDTRDDEEERRLFYVALTRARKKLFLCHANVRTVYGSRTVTIPSQFLNDIDTEFFETRHEHDNAIKVIYLD